LIDDYSFGRKNNFLVENHVVYILVV